MFNTNAKFIVIASTFRFGASQAANIENHVEAHDTLTAHGFTHKDVLGFYKEDGAEVGNAELSLAIPCTTAAQIKSMARLFCGGYNQDCIAVWNRDSNTLWLADKEGHVFHTCGAMHMSKTLPDTQAWTYTGGFYFYAE
ncbi:SAM-dependent methyltransferase [Lelliottia phage phD2B]|uniref:Putative S-adenosyl-L-methionine hydrolase n=1 Tax=Lelliottia phage phD2B TaxID=1542498 RepID=A0A088FWL0_9CAUD|nr:SAM-dependent methyltransferase [Lelliottia phage phD2B]AIM51232.1 putative S-adenosyl-L-methionine hydrolase [Lelliottia phage phD2B]